MKHCMILVVASFAAVQARIPFHGALSTLSVTKASSTDIKTKEKDLETTTEYLRTKLPDETALCEQNKLDMRLHGPLLKDIEMLTDLLADVVKRENPRVHDLYDKLRKFGLKRAADLLDDNASSTEALKQMIDLAEELSAKEALGVMRTFSMALNLVNAAEVHHRLRLVQRVDSDKEDSGPLPMIEDSIAGTFSILSSDMACSPQSIFDQLLNQKVEIVLTAHPTEVNRRTHLRKYRRISEILGDLERFHLAPYERNEAMVELRRIISSLWGSDEIRRTKPTPQQEALGGVAIIESVLWEAVPAYMRKLDAQCQITLGKRLPIDVVPIRFASWIGGDRDGNPNVTPAVTKEVVTLQRLRGAKMLLNDFHALYNELAISSRFSPDMEELANKVTDSPDKLEKYRRVIGHLRKRLAKTIKVCEGELAVFSKVADPSTGAVETFGQVYDWQDAEPIYDATELLTQLKVMYNSLTTTGFELVADGLLLDIIRRVVAFGMTLVPIDIREESTKHTLALDSITRYLGVGSYKEWDEETRLSFLQAELASKRPLIRASEISKMDFDESVVTTLLTFHMASSLRPESLGAYVISQAQTASDVLAVMLLQKQFGMTVANGNMMRVVPLFETLEDLENAPSRLDTLFSIPTYVGAIKACQEIMVGYSDSAKDAGRLAACWAQYNSQVRIMAIAKKHGIELTFFHGKGGTVGRGGNPALYRAILSHPPKTINGRFRVTEQGEMITKNFGAPAIAERTLDIYTAAVLREAFMEQVQPTKKWRKQMERVANVSCGEYRFLVREEPRFVPYFRQATPELELGSLNIGSRPAKRNPKGGIESLRAIPWTFAWTQTRTHLSAWLGVGAGLQSENIDDLETLRTMYNDWPWFRENIDLIAMILSKTDFSISENYDRQLVDNTPELMDLGNEVRGKLVQTRQAVLDVTQSTDVAGAHVALLRASSSIRHPYVDPINIVQAELLKRLRKLEKERESDAFQEAELKQTLQDALVISITGVAEGMRNSG
jgi:phosphoenolpyruvate carboxylase